VPCKEDEVRLLWRTRRLGVATCSVLARVDPAFRAAIPQVRSTLRDDGRAAVASARWGRRADIGLGSIAGAASFGSQVLFLLNPSAWSARGRLRLRCVGSCDLG